MSRESSLRTIGFALALLAIVPARAQNDPASRRAAIDAMYPVMLQALEAKNYGRARNICDQAILWEPMNPTHHYNLACIEALAGGARLPQAMNELEVAIALGFNDVNHLQTDPDLAALRKDPKFRELVQRVMLNSVAPLAGNTAALAGKSAAPSSVPAPTSRAGANPGSAEDPPFRIERSTVLTSRGAYHWSQSRPAIIPGHPAQVIVTTQQIEKRGSHGYRDLFIVETTDDARTWSAPQRIESLKRRFYDDGIERVFGDVCPQWHAATGKLLITGKCFGFLPNAAADKARDDRAQERVAYAVYSPATKRWTGMKIMPMPAKDHEGCAIIEPNAGCHQRVDLPNGDILLPVRYRKDPAARVYTTIVARCTFDGDTLTYREHGSEFSITPPRGLYEPSLCKFGARYFLTMRAEDSGYVARGNDGLHFEPLVEWKFDDGQALGSANSQQHWITHGDRLYLIYSRRGANNDHVFRNRAPIFIAEVNPETLRVRRASEQVLLPETGLDLTGGFAPVNVSPHETWVISSEMAFPKDRQDENNRVLLAKIIWPRT